jgi:Fic family protein
LHYIRALKYGMKRVREDQFPLSLRFVCELHKELMENARATQFSDPGYFRKTQNWIGGSRADNASYVPPPVQEMQNALADLEKFIHADDAIPAVIKAGLIHAQFETIHPFLDGNGRTGRMLILFCLWQSRSLKNPVLFLSSYFKRHQRLYYQRLEGYHHGEVYQWVDFFLEGVIEIANEAVSMINKITKLREKDTAKIQTLGKRALESAGQVFSKLYGQPVVNVALIQKWTGFTTRAGAQTIIDRLVKMNILEPKDKDKKYGQSYVYKEYLKIFMGND